MYEVSFRNAGKWIDLNENWGKIDFDYLLWLMRRCEARGGLLTVPDGSRKLPFNVLPMAAMDRFFNTTTTFTMPSYSSDDGYIDSGANASWATVRGATTGTANITESDMFIISQLVGGNYRIYRSFVRYTTGSLPDTDTIDSWKIQLAGNGNAETNANTTTIEVVVSTASSPIVNDDYDNITFASKGSFAFADWNQTLGTYNDINGGDNSVINKTADTLFGLITGRDLNNSAPTGINSVECVASNADTYNPKLEVVHTAAVVGRSYGYIIG